MFSKIVRRTGFETLTSRAPQSPRSPKGVTSLGRRAPDWEHLNYGVKFAQCLRQVRLVGLALMNVQFQPNVLLNKGAQVASAVRQLDGATDLRLQVMQDRRSVQGCDHPSQLIPELRQFFSSQGGAVARMEHTCLSGLELDLACQPVRVGIAHLVGPFVSGSVRRAFAGRPHPLLKAIRCSFRERRPGYERQPEGAGRARDRAGDPGELRKS